MLDRGYNFLYCGEPKLEPRFTETKVSVFHSGLAVF